MHYPALNILTILIFIIYQTVAIRCPDITVRYGRVKYRSRGRVAIFGCWAGFTLYGEKYAGCFRGSWDVTPPKCVRKGCNDVTFRFGAIKKPFYNTAVLGFRCYPGYELVGPKEIYCDGISYDNLPPVCKREETDISCDFENQRLCKWRNDPTANLTLNLRQYGTLSNLLHTGPDHDHTLDPEVDGYYLSLNSSSAVPGETARIFSPYLPHANDDNTCFKFWYHMYGSTIGALRVYINETKSFEKQGNKGDRWRLGKVKLPSKSHFKIVVEVVAGNGYNGDIALDDLDVGECTDDSGSTCADRCSEEESDEFSQCDCHPGCKYDDSCCSDFGHFCEADTTTEIAETTMASEESSPNNFSTFSPTISSVDETNFDTIEPEIFTSDSTNNSELKQFTFNDAFTAQEEPFELSTQSEITENNEINTEISKPEKFESKILVSSTDRIKSAELLSTSNKFVMSTATKLNSSSQTTTRYNLRPRTTKRTTTSKATTLPSSRLILNRTISQTVTKIPLTKMSPLKTVKPKTYKTTVSMKTTTTPTTLQTILKKDPKITTHSQSVTKIKTQTTPVIVPTKLTVTQYKKLNKYDVKTITNPPIVIVTKSKVEKFRWTPIVSVDTYGPMVIVHKDASVNYGIVVTSTVFFIAVVFLTILAIYMIRKRRLSSHSNDGAEILFIPTDETLDFSHASNYHQERDSGVYSETVMSLKREKS